MSIIFVLVDALRNDYLEYHGTARFLTACAETGLHVRRLVPSLGFCERVEILTGVGFPENGFLAAIGRRPGKAAPYRFGKWLPESLMSSRYARALLWQLATRLHIRLLPYEIPIPILAEMVLTEDATDHTQLSAFSQESLVDVFLGAGLKIYWQYAALGMRNGTDSSRIEALKQAFAEHKHDLFMLYLGELDALGHRFGPLSPEVGAGIRWIDCELEAIYKAALQVDSAVTVVVVGDHGMTQIDTVINVQKIIAMLCGSYGLVLWHDFRIFLDSTMCRIWGCSQKFKRFEPQFIAEFQAALEYSGKWLVGSADPAIYGEHIWLCKPGVLIYPDFFHCRGQPCAAMHGYEPTDLSTHGLAIVFGKTVVRRQLPQGSLSDVAGSLCRLANLPPPRNALGTPWFD